VFADRATSPQAAHVEEPLKAAAQMSTHALVEELAVVAARQAELVTQLKARAVVEEGTLAQKDEEIALLKAQLADARKEVESTSAYAGKLADKRLSLLVDLNQERNEMREYRSNFSWGLKYLQLKRGEHFANLDEFCKKVEGKVAAQEEKLRRLSIEYDEELYPHLMSMIAERRYLSYIILYVYLYIYFFSLTHPLATQSPH
jgi:predicted  nucleic acid-binding Zn-ribbon protein